MDTESGTSHVAPGPLGLSRNAIILIAVLALLAAFGWWRSFDRSRELAAVRQAATAAETELEAEARRRRRSAGRHREGQR